MLMCSSWMYTQVLRDCLWFKLEFLRILRNLGLGFISNLVLDQIFRFLVVQSSPSIKYKQCSKFHQFPMDIFGVMKVFGISLQSAEVPELSPEVPDVCRTFPFSFHFSPFVIILCPNSILFVSFKHGQGSGKEN